MPWLWHRREALLMVAIGDLTGCGPAVDGTVGLWKNSRWPRQHASG